MLELKVLKLLRKAGLPEPRAQFIVRSGGIVVARVDFAYPEIKLAMEADGYRYHGDASAWRRDLARRNSLTALGWRIIHVTWDDVTRRPSQVVGDIQQATEARGYR